VAKSNRGLPPDFNLNIPDSVRDEPVQLGDYLDEVDAAPATIRPQAPIPKRSETPKKSESKVVEMPRVHEPPPAPLEPEPPAPPVFPKAKRKAPKLPQRKQMNMTPETLRMIEELIYHVKTYSVQRDAKGSEVFHALVLSLYEAQEYLDLSEVPARGRWGTPTAQAITNLWCITGNLDTPGGNVIARSAFDAVAYALPGSKGVIKLHSKEQDKKRIPELKRELCGKCEHRGCGERRLSCLEFAHLRSTPISRTGPRDRKEKAADVAAHPNAYKLLCEKHHNHHKQAKEHDARMRRLGRR